MSRRRLNFLGKIPINGLKPEAIPKAIVEVRELFGISLGASWLLGFENHFSYAWRIWRYKLFDLPLFFDLLKDRAFRRAVSAATKSVLRTGLYA